MRNAWERPRRRRGFTLMELMLVMAILVILLGLAVPRFMGTQKKANINAAKSQIGLFKGALEMYAADSQNYPTTEQGLAVLIEAPDDEAARKNWGGPYLDGDPPKDPWGHDYQYAYPPAKNEKDFPDIWSFGPDGEDGTEDDVVNWETDENSEG